MTDGGPVIGIVGLGIMGTAMGANIAAAGFELIGYDVEPARAQYFAGQAVASVGDVAAAGEIILLALPSPGALAVVAAELATSGRPGTVVVEMGTLALADKVAARDRLAEAGLTLLDVPVSGTGLQAADATLVVFSSGDRQAHERAAPVFDVIGKQTFYLGAFGNGSRMKYVANLLVAVNTLAAAEAHNLGAALGLDAAVIQEVIAPGAGGSTMFDVRGPMMVADEYDPPAARLAIILKDARIIEQHARGAGAPTPLLDATIPIYEAATAGGLGDLDAAALRRLLARQSR